VTYHDFKAKHRIVNCNGHQVQSTRNLYEALQELVIQFPDTYLWNDVICINQQDLKEVHIQVAMMANIYAAAHSVIIWLGKDGEETQ
jgi:hypothetical protein